MGLLNAVMRQVFRRRMHRIRQFSAQPTTTQTKLLNQFIAENRHTEIGKRFDFGSIRTPQQFADRLPVVDYEPSKTTSTEWCTATATYCGTARFGGSPNRAERPTTALNLSPLRCKIYVPVTCAARGTRRPWFTINAPILNFLTEKCSLWAVVTSRFRLFRPQK